VRAPIILVPFALEWIILVTSLTPTFLKGRFRRSPKLGLALWFTLFATAILSAITALVVAIWALFELIQGTEETGVEVGLLSNLALWVLIALAGITLALVNQKTEPLLEQAAVVRPELEASASFLEKFRGRHVYEIEFPMALAFVAKIGGRHSIVVTSETRKVLDADELEAVYFHELGHINGRHNLLKAIARFVVTITPRLRASKFLVAETDELVELVADSYARRFVGASSLRAARSKFLE
jgi:Zn-dependent protease with chaperone function